jgi:transportin-3
MILSFRSSATPMLSDLAKRLVEGFAATRQGCFLWATDAIVREFSDHAENIDPGITFAVIVFYEKQAQTFLQVLSNVPAEQQPDLIEDFFRLSIDVLQHHANRAITSSLMGTIFSAACHALTLLKIEVVMVTLHFLRDFIGYGTANPPSSRLADEPALVNPPEVQQKVKQLLLQYGDNLTQRVLAGMMYSFPEDCIPDASGVVMDMLRVLPQETGAWISATLHQLPAGAIRPHERDRLVSQIDQYEFHIRFFFCKIR